MLDYCDMEEYREYINYYGRSEYYESSYPLVWKNDGKCWGIQRPPDYRFCMPRLGAPPMWKRNFKFPNHWRLNNQTRCAPKLKRNFVKLYWDDAPPTTSSYAITISKHDELHIDYVPRAQNPPNKTAKLRESSTDVNIYVPGVDFNRIDLSTPRGGSFDFTAYYDMSVVKNLGKYSCISVPLWVLAIWYAQFLSDPIASLSDVVELTTSDPIAAASADPSVKTRVVQWLGGVGLKEFDWIKLNLCNTGINNVYLKNITYTTNDHADFDTIGVQYISNIWN
jgi:hypothetical protein